MTAQYQPQQSATDLAIGQPDPALLPVSLNQTADFHWHDLAYGKQQGDDDFRQQLAAFLTEDYGHSVSADALMITNGSANALNMICQRFSQPGQTVLVEQHSYFIALQQLREFGLQPTAVATDEQGPLPEALEQALQQCSPAFFYLIPSYQNPTGVTIPLARRLQLLQLCQRYNCLMIADEVYQSLYFGQQPPPSMACLAKDSAAPVLAIGSMSKILAPGLRLGWIQAHSELLSPLIHSALLNSGGGLAPLASRMVCRLMQQGHFIEHLHRLRAEYHQRAETLYSALQPQMGDDWTLNPADGGFFLWLKSAHLPAAGCSPGISWLPGERCEPAPAKTQERCARLCFAYHPLATLQQAGQQLALELRQQQSVAK